MKENLPDMLKNRCCTCLSEERKLYPLAHIHNGYNNLFLLLTSEDDTCKEDVYRNAFNYYMCWECRATVSKINQFRQQASTASKHLNSLLNGETDAKLFTIGLSRLGRSKNCCLSITASDWGVDFIECDPLQGRVKCEYDVNIVSRGGRDYRPRLSDCTTPISEELRGEEIDMWTDNHIDHDPLQDIKHEVESDMDTPLSQLKGKCDEKRILEKDLKKTAIDTPQPGTKVKNKKSKHSACLKKKKAKKALFSIETLSNQEMLELRKKRLTSTGFEEATSKCESCIEVFESDAALQQHNKDSHSPLPYRTQCDVCLCYMRRSELASHREDHSRSYSCRACAVACYTKLAIAAHLTHAHGIHDLTAKTKRGTKKTSKMGIKTRRNYLDDEPTPFGFKCTDCNEYFENKKKRWKHLQRVHREGYRCPRCDKRFPFKFELAKHQLSHASGAIASAMWECGRCGRVLPAARAAQHARGHARSPATPHAGVAPAPGTAPPHAGDAGAPPRPSCAPCGQHFASYASYTYHLKHTKAHATRDVLRHKCSTCPKAFRSAGELRDHVAYRHRRLAAHQCPRCPKALATARGLTRHVKRAHEGFRENRRDKVCQQCGKLFLERKTLREHELSHSGLRPLACGACPRAFRQRAALYTHRRTAHAPRPAPAAHTT